MHDFFHADSALRCCFLHRRENCIFKGITGRRREHFHLATHLAKKPSLHGCVGSFILVSAELTCFNVQESEGRVAVDLVVIAQVVILGPIYLCENYTLSKPVREIVNELIPLGLENLALVAILHVEVQHDELTRVFID